ncbi:DUF4194 domain-containing protein [Virgisporangium aurantiacum]|uniref:DUF4194 domain-containing protein n=1 Tax=Virgisporangium aurantiacum TaxID=175570 RepID=A0A8J3ZGF2_9ACTN|nr:DUF4194 domain-containing protein [Virgisporangium aurantiacum]GIJ63664.1 hypothetical protein Vau01_111800 [Virgisporangium aurantiacum]
MSLDDVFLANGSIDGWDDSDRESTSSVALFEGDEGALELLQRRTLVALLKQRFITAQSHPKEWRTLIANPRPIRSRLNDMFLDLHLDAAREVAYKRQVAPEGGGRFPTLLFDTAWSREETALMVYLRIRSRSEEAAGASRSFVERQDMVEHVAALRPAHATDHVADGRRAVKAIESLNRAGLLIGASTADRFEVSPAIDVVLPLERLQELLRWLSGRHGGEDARTDRDGSEMISNDIAYDGDAQ